MDTTSRSRGEARSVNTSRALRALAHETRAQSKALREDARALRERARELREVSFVVRARAPEDA